MRVARGTTRDVSGVTRLRLLVGAAVVTALLAIASSASASRIETGGAGPAQDYAGFDWLGRVTLSYGEAGQHGFGFFAFTFANLCSRRGTQLNSSVTVTVGKNKLFHYRGHGFSLNGNVIGPISSPREIAGTATFAGKGCRGGTWWFAVTPKK
jgi:hypothetical protein